MALVTAKQLEQLSPPDTRVELVSGKLRQLPFGGFEHGHVTGSFSRMLSEFVHKNQLGEFPPAGTGFLLECDPDTVRAPDAAFISDAKLATLSKSFSSFAPIAPDLVVEVVSPSDTFQDVEEKARFWLEHGSLMVLVIDPGTKTLRVYEDRDSIKVLSMGDVFVAGAVIPEWQFAVSELFE